MADIQKDIAGCCKQLKLSSNLAEKVQISVHRNRHSEMSGAAVSA